WNGEDWRAQPQHARRHQLEALVQHADQARRPSHQQSSLLPAEPLEAGEAVLMLSPILNGADWQALAQQREASRERGVEGMMLKARDAHYGVGRTKDVGVWWKWKIDPYSVDAVLIYAQRGHGRRASLYTDFTFAV